jgi:diadenosine tetraphosphate (Ap4A) HIT family hydrolase
MSDQAFELDPRLAAGSIPLGDWPLCSVRLKDDRRFPWLLLVPRRAGAVELTDLGAGDYTQLAAEIRAATALVIDVARPDKTNVATLGNAVPQLHVHVIARFRGDAAWPRPVWCIDEGPAYGKADRAAVIARYTEAAAAHRPA